MIAEPVLLVVGSVGIAASIMDSTCIGVMAVEVCEARNPGCQTPVARGECAYFPRIKSQGELQSHGFH